MGLFNFIFGKIERRHGDMVGIKKQIYIDEKLLKDFTDYASILDLSASQLISRLMKQHLFVVGKYNDEPYVQTQKIEQKVPENTPRKVVRLE